jgi:hypothetical protein
MLERRTFIVRIHAGVREPIVEDVTHGESVRLPDLDAIGAEIERRLGDAERVEPRERP